MSRLSDYRVLYLQSRRTARLRLVSWIALFLAGTLATNPVQAQASRNYDINYDGVISPAEYRAFLLVQTHIPPGVLDQDGDDEISTEELDELAGLLRGIEDRVSLYEIESGDGLDVDTFNRQVGLVEATPERPAGLLDRMGILVRGNLESLSLFSDAKPLNAASAATVAYSRDITDGQAWSTIKGALMRPVRFESRPNLIVLPSITFNRTQYSESTSRGTDTLILRTALDRLYPLPDNEWLDSVSLRVNPAYITDSRFDTAIVSAEIQLQTTATQLGIGMTIPIGDFQLRWQPSLFAEYGSVVRRQENVQQDDRVLLFVRTGPGVELEFWLRSLEQLHVSLAGYHMASLTSDTRGRKRAEVSLSLALDDAGHLSLQAKYVNGDSSAKLENEELWTLGLGIKY